MPFVPARATFLTAALVALSCGDPPPAPVGLQLTGRCMGTMWSAVVVTEAEAMVEEASVRRVIQTELDAVDAALSTWKDTSDLSRLARTDPGTPIETAEVTRDVLRLAAPWVCATDGAFDPAVGALLKVWGFDDHDGSADAPSEAEIEAARELVDWEAIEIDETTVRRTRLGVEIDLSAIAKGHAVDLAAEALLDAGFDDFLLEVGGETVVRGNRPSGTPWRIGIEHPIAPEGVAPRSPLSLVSHPKIARLVCTDVAVATSGDYRNVREVDGRVVAHAIDPRTGRPIEHDLRSVTVVAATCATADALATAALVLGPLEGLELLERTPGVEGLLLVRTGDASAPVASRTTTGIGDYGLEWAEPVKSAD